METLQDVFFHELADILHAEKQLVKTLPKMAKAATSDKLRTAFEDHLEETKTHVDRIEQVFELFDKSPRAKKCKAMEGLVTEGEELIKEEDENIARDAGLIASAQKVEHYEIATYGTLCAWAAELANPSALQLLKQNMEEEKAADAKLSKLAEGVINPLAEMGNGADEDDEE